MMLGLSTHWNAFRHASGETLIEEILTLGFNRVELGYDLRLDLVDGVRRMVDQKAVTVTSVHNFCPVPLGASQGHPELFTLANPDARIRAAAVRHTERTIVFAAEIGAKAVVMHGGNIRLWWNRGSRLLKLAAAGKRHTPRYERIKTGLMTARAAKAAVYLDYLRDGITQLLPKLEEYKIRLALENLPSWESVPTEPEAEQFFQQMNSPWLAYWHDTGHGQIRENLGFTAHLHWIEKLTPWLAGMHVHDVATPFNDHLPPLKGTVDFGAMKPFIKPGMPLILEPHPGVPAEAVQEGAAQLEKIWIPPPP